HNALRRKSSYKNAKSCLFYSDLRAFGEDDSGRSILDWRANFAENEGSPEKVWGLELKGRIVGRGADADAVPNGVRRRPLLIDDCDGEALRIRPATLRPVCRCHCEH